MSDSIRVFNADDHPMLCKGVANLFRETDGIEWVGSAHDGKEAIEKLFELEPDVAVLDIEMPHFSGVEVVEVLLKKKIKTKFILLTLFKDETFFKSALGIGAKGYLLKDSSEQEIINCVKAVHAGQTYVNSSLTHFLIPGGYNSSVLDELSDHERNILKLISRKKTTSEIADMLFISPKTVSNHRNNISKKLDLGGKQNGLMKWALEHKSEL